MMNAFNTCGTCEVSRICWSTSLSNRLDVFSIDASIVEAPLKPCFSLAHTSFFMPSESLLAFLLPLEENLYVDEMNGRVTDDIHFSMPLCNEDTLQVSDIAQLLQHYEYSCLESDCNSLV